MPTIKKRAIEIKDGENYLEEDLIIKRIVYCTTCFT